MTALLWLDPATLTTKPHAAAIVSRMRTLPIWIGGILLATGLILGFTPLHSQGTTCGSAYHPHHTNPYLPTPGDCDGARSQMRAPALALTLAGAGVLVVWGVMRSQAATREHRTILGRPPRRRDDDPAED